MPGDINTEGVTNTEPIGAQDASKKSDIASSLSKWGIVCVLIITALVYSRAIFNGFTNFDDDFYIIKNPYLKDFSIKGIWAICTTFYTGNYHPLTTLSFLLEYHFFGEQPMIYHITNVAFHLLNTWVVYRLILQLGSKQVTALIVALLFAIHPMHVESVAWISERKDVMYGLFYLLSISTYLKYLDSGLNKKWYVFAFLWFIASLLSKSAAVTLPVLLIAIDVYKNRRITLPVIWEKAPMLALSVLFGILNIKAQEQGGAITDLTFNFINRIFLLTSAPVFYIVKLITPFNLSALHFYPDVHNGSLPAVYYVSLLVLAVAAIALWKLKGPFKKEVVFGTAFFFISVSVMLQIISVGVALTSERYTYIPYIGLFYIVGQLIAKGIEGEKKEVVMSVFVIFTTFFCIQSYMRIGVWENSETILTDVINTNKDIADCSYYYWLRGNVRTNNGNLNGGIDDFTKAIDQRPDYAEAYGNRGAAYSQAENYAAAIGDFNHSISLNPADPRPFYNRAAVKASAGDLTGAFEDYSAFLVRVPRNPRAYMDRGMVRFTLKDSAGACEDWKKAVSLGNGDAAQFLQQYCK